MSIDSAIPVAWDVLKCVVTPIKRQFGYVMSSKSYALDLNKEVGNLENEVLRVQVVAEVARNNLRNFHNVFTEWEASTEKALKEAQDLLRNFENDSKTCCHGTFPDPKCRYQFSRNAEGKIEVIKQLTQKCNGFKGLNDISFSDPAPGNVAAPNLARREGKGVVQRTTMTASTSFASTSIKLTDDSVFESRASIIRDIMAALADNSKSVVGVYGMGGVGKSTLLADVEKRIKEDKSFNLVAKAEVSENPDIKRIQGEIAHALGLDIKNEEYVNVRADLLRRRLENEEKMKHENDEEKMKHENDEERKKKKVLIILDNLWEALDLKSVGIPCGHDNKVRGCKLLLTSRDRDILQKEMGCDDPFHLGELQEEEARRLFERYVEDKVHDFEFKTLVDEALHKCAGLPFLIVQMAKLLKHANLSGWKNVLKQLKLSKNEGIGVKINKMLQLSYDHLKGEDVKSLLRLCVVCGVSKPSLENLVRYGVGLGLFREDNMEEARESVTSSINTLQASSLLLEDEDACSIKIHDLVREFVASVASKDHPFLVLKDKDKLVTEWSKDKPKSCRAICFPNIDMKQLPEELDCPELEIFLLFANNESLIVPNSYFNSMRKLAVLNLKGIRLSHSPLSFQLLENLHTLCLDGCLLEDVASIGNLKGLQILSFVNSKIHRLPKEITQLAELRLLDLNHCSRLQVIEPGVLGSLIKLEELYMENSFDEWNAVERTPPTNASLIELNNMKNLYTLHVSIPDLSALPEDLNIEKLIKYRIQIGNTRNWSSKYKGLKALNLKLNTMNDILQKGCVRTTLERSDDLYLDGLNGIEQSFSELSLEGFPTLKHLRIKNNPSVRYILGWHSPTAFKLLESLHLKNLINLEKICYNISCKPFNTLKVVRVVECHKMEVLFPLSLLRELPQLEEIGVVNCNLMREIVGVDDCGKVELHNLHVLELRDLPSIKNFFTPKTAPSSSTSNTQVGSQAVFFNGQQVSMPSLESLIMSGLPNLKDIWSDESPLGVRNVQSLEVLGCKSLSKVIDFLSLVKLHKLHTLSIRDCISVQEIFDLVGPSTGGNVTLFELTDLNLFGLLSLRCIWNKNPCGIVRFHNLKKLDVFWCDKLEFLFLPSMVQSLPQLGALEVWLCKKMETIIMEEEGQGMETSKTLVFPMLTNISFRYMKSLTCFSHEKCFQEAWSQDHVKSSSIALFNQEVAFPSLETLEIVCINNIERIWDNQVAMDSMQNLKSLYVEACDKLKCVWNRELHCQVKFQYLRSIRVSKCKGLTTLFPALVARDLMQLEELNIDNCGIVELIEKEGLIPKVVFPRLTSLKLEHLTKLKCIYRTHALHWPMLKTLEVHGCNKLEIFASQPENEMPLHKQPLFTVEKGAFPNLQELKLDLSEQMELWHEHFHSEEFFSKLRVLELCHLSKESTVSTCCFVKSLTNLEKLVVYESYLED
ncbi:disease resistance protein At4g27190-like [Eucalyptus grandis]|uniref:disease resistance protein At4g27190-like n=1 Tax=Eucalyptus grandis TaxID=71139 RepID=UPI00192E826D|nr:disease resistance protein At4g27190-like [Eucalyptus grandis]